MFPYLLIIPERFNSSLARAVAGAAESLRQTAIRPILQEGAALTREYHFWEWNYPTVLAKENSRKLRESYLKKKLQEIEDELKKLED